MLSGKKSVRGKIVLRSGWLLVQPLDPLRPDLSVWVPVIGWATAAVRMQLSGGSSFTASPSVLHSGVTYRLMHPGRRQRQRQWQREVVVVGGGALFSWYRWYSRSPPSLHTGWMQIRVLQWLLLDFHCVCILLSFCVCVWESGSVEFSE